MSEFRSVPARQLSHGQKQWLEIGMVMMQRPELLLLDEPIAGMTEEEEEKNRRAFIDAEKAVRHSRR